MCGRTSSKNPTALRGGWTDETSLAASAKRGPSIAKYESRDGSGKFPPVTDVDTDSLYVSFFNGGRTAS